MSFQYNHLLVITFSASMWWDTVACHWRFTELKRMQETSGLHETFAWCSAHPALHFQSHACRTQPEQNVEFWNPRNSVDTCVLCVGYLHSLSFTHYPQLWLSGLVPIHYTKKLIWISCQATVMTFRTAKYENASASEHRLCGCAAPK